MIAIDKHLDDIRRYESIVKESKNQYVINDYSKAIRRLKRELKVYCDFRCIDYNKVLKNYEKSAN